MAKFCPLFSGSKGNCVYIGSGDNGILIDAGRSAKQINDALAQKEISASGIEAVFITHEHSDHTKGLRVFAKKHKIPVYATAGTICGMRSQKMVDETTNLIEFCGELELGNFRVKSFSTSHDTIEPCGFVVEILSDGRKIAVCTDLGVITDEVRAAIEGCDLVMLESNHDVGMLMTGAYPYQLKQRIIGAKGHLSNEACAEEVVRLVENGATRLFLAHLSEENNYPDLALQSAVCALTQAGYREGFDYSIEVCSPINEKKVVVF